MSQAPRQVCFSTSLRLGGRRPALCLLRSFANTDPLASHPDECEQQNHVLIFKQDALLGTVGTLGRTSSHPSCTMQTGGQKPGSYEDQPCLSTVIYCSLPPASSLRSYSSSAPTTPLWMPSQWKQPPLPPSEKEEHPTNIVCPARSARFRLQPRFPHPKAFQGPSPS